MLLRAENGKAAGQKVFSAPAKAAGWVSACVHRQPQLLTLTQRQGEGLERPSAVRRKKVNSRTQTDASSRFYPGLVTST